MEEKRLVLLEGVSYHFDPLEGWQNILPLFHSLFSGSLSIVTLDTYTFKWQYFYILNFIAHLLRISLSGPYKLASVLNLF